MFGHSQIICTPSLFSFFAAFNVSVICLPALPNSVVTGC